jgi:hypothetical protein
LVSALEEAFTGHHAFLLSKMLTASTAWMLTWLRWMGASRR